jgi:hypothetical protein
LTDRSHVAGERERAAGKADQRHAPGERLRDQAHRIGHVAQARANVGDGEPRDVFLGAHRPLELRPFAFREIQAEAHRIGHGEDV